MQKFIEGTLIYLRPFSRQDISTWFNWFNDPLVTEHMNKGAFPNTEVAQEEYFHSLSKSKNDIQMAIAMKKDNHLVGCIGIHKIEWLHRRGDMSIVIGNRECWGKGIASEAIGLMTTHAFMKLNLNKLTAGVWATNTSSKKAFKKNGFIEEGILRQNFFYQGKYVDDIKLGIVREEWVGRK